MKIAVLIPTLTLSALLARADDKIDFAKSVQPLLEKRCVECHNEKKTKGDLRLDTKAEAFKADKVLVPGKADDSHLIQRVSLPAGHDDIMPPKGDPLTKEQIDLLKKWINEGANWPDSVNLSTEAPKKEETAAATEPKKTEATTSAAKKTKKKAPGQEFANLKPAKDAAKEEEAVKKLGALGISVRPIAQNLSWKEATVRPQDTNKTSEAVALLKDIPSLVDLNLAKLNLKDDDLKNIAELTNLQRLHLENNPITDAGFAHLKGLVNLEYLNLYNTEVADGSIDHLKAMTNLAALYLWQSKVSDEGAEKLKAALPETMINRGEELKLLAKAEEKRAEEKKADDAKKAEEAKKAEDKKKEEEAKKAEEKKKEEKPAEPKKEEKKEEKKDDKADEKKPEEKKADKPEEKKIDDKKA
ncbi:MAG TPA: c-type cytochrome domain-containing protein [Candidatus Kapabacteria bacterium]|nr:c-type cytochrome domain-containing protein [Candidatus Kapabacteria bacterium]